MTETEETTTPDGGTYLAIQPVTKWFAKLAVKGGSVSNIPADDAVLYNSINECIDANETEAEATDFGYRVSSKQLLDTLDYDPEALIRVYRAFMENKLPREVAIKIVNDIQAAGVVFGIRPTESEPAESVSEEPTEAPEGASEDVIQPGEDG
jgi:hypothetical protein